MRSLRRRIDVESTSEGLSATVGVAVGALDVDVALSVAPGEVVGLLGPNGAGKTTVLRALAGLQALAHGRIDLAGTTLDDPDSGVFVPAEHRRVGVVFQDLRLLPHLTARDDVSFGLRARRVPRAQARAVADEWLARVGLDARAAAPTSDLSGGEAQRVALARALAIDPALLLLDEPLAALDVATRAEVRRVLRAHLDAFAGPAILVTHDAVDALTLADRLVVVDRGRVIQHGTPREVARRPGSPWVADLVGITLLAGRCRTGSIVEVEGVHELTTASADPSGHGLRAGDEVHVAVRPSSVALHRRRPEGSPRNVWRAVVGDVEVTADRVRVLTEGPIAVTADITTSALADLALAPGDEVWVSVKATELDVYPR